MNLINIIVQIKSKPVYMLLGSAILLMLVAPGVFRGSRRHRRRRGALSLPVRRSRRKRSVLAPVTKYRRRSRAKGAKKPWQIKGSEAARRHMAKLRRMR